MNVIRIILEKPWVTVFVIPKISLPTSFTLQNVKSTPMKVLIDLIRHMRSAQWKDDFDTFESTTTFLSSVCVAVFPLAWCY